MLRKTGGKGRKPTPLSKDEGEVALSRQEASVLWVCKDPDAGQTAESRGIAEAEDRQRGQRGQDGTGLQGLGKTVPVIPGAMECHCRIFTGRVTGLSYVLW